MPRQSSVSKIRPPPAAPLVTSSRISRGGGVVVGGRTRDHQDQLDVGLVGEVHRQETHHAQVGVGVDDHPELADVEVERLVLVENVNEGVADSLEHVRHVRPAAPWLASPNLLSILPGASMPSPSKPARAARRQRR